MNCRKCRKSEGGMNIIHSFSVMCTLMLLALCCISCFKDLKPPAVLPLIAGDKLIIDSIDMHYFPFINDTVKIHPEVKNSDGTPIDTAAYRAVWIQRTIESSYSPLAQPIDTVFGYNLVYPADKEYVGSYLWEYRIINKKTGASSMRGFSINTTTPTDDGFFVLSQTGPDQSRLGLIYYNRGLSDYDTITDILRFMYTDILRIPPAYQIKGIPHFLSQGFSNYVTFFIALSTSGGAAFLDPATLLPSRLNKEDRADLWDFENLMNTGLGKTVFDPEKVLSMATTLRGIYLNYDHRFFVSDILGRDFLPSKLTAPGIESREITPSKWMVLNGGSLNDYNAVIFGENTQEFYLVSEGGYTDHNMEVLPFFLPYREKKKLLYASYTPYGHGRCYAVLQNNNNDSTFLLTFDFGAKQYFYGPLVASGLDSATHFAVSDTYGYLFYNLGSQIFEFDLNSRRSILMADYGDKVVSYMDAVPKPFVATSNAVDQYKALSNSIIVATYDKSGDMAASGTVDFFSVPAANGIISKQKSYAGFGKVASILYRRY